MKRRVLFIVLLLVLVCVIGCAEDKDSKLELTDNTEKTKIQKMLDDGTISGYVRGDTKFLVWKNEAMGINSAKNYKFAIIDHKGKFEKDFFSYDFELRNGINEIEHVGSNIFEIATVDNKMMYHNIEKDDFFSFNKNERMYQIIEDFSDGYAVISSMYPSYEEKGKEFNSIYYYELVLLSDTGTCIDTNVFMRGPNLGGKGEGNQIGKYGNGVFFYDDAFYNKEGVKVLDLSNMFIENEPYFDGEYCWIEYHDFEFVWGAWMDINGNFKEEAQKLRELGWN